MYTYNILLYFLLINIVVLVRTPNLEGHVSKIFSNHHYMINMKMVLNFYPRMNGGWSRPDLLEINNFPCYFLLVVYFSYKFLSTYERKKARSARLRLRSNND